ncbi:MAG: RsmB/NOP family class I SAM-dependent RNA methyltransferase [Deferrisomatales bacterium]
MSRFGRVFDRYRELIPGFPEFLEAVERPCPLHVRVNTLKTRAERVRQALEAAGRAVAAEPWWPLLLRCDADEQAALGATLLHGLGHIYIQSASSALAALCLGAQPGDAVLDLCAAPGSKTTLLAQLMEDRGLLVSNEPNRRRQRSLVANVERMGATCVLITGYAGQNFPLRQRFARVLVDAPCSGEGTWRGPRARPRAVRPELRRHLHRQQSALLRRGYEVLEPGGVLVYSTCTFAPEENEAVVGPFVAETGARVLPLERDPAGEPGLTEWEGQRWPAELARARRLYPHRLDSEGFFVVRLAKP